METTRHSETLVRTHTLNQVVGVTSEKTCNLQTCSQLTATFSSVIQPRHNSDASAVCNVQVRMLTSQYPYLRHSRVLCRRYDSLVCYSVQIAPHVIRQQQVHLQTRAARSITKSTAIQALYHVLLGRLN